MALKEVESALRADEYELDVLVASEELFDKHEHKVRALVAQLQLVEHNVRDVLERVCAAAAAAGGGLWRRHARQVAQ